MSPTVCIKDRSVWWPAGLRIYSTSHLPSVSSVLWFLDKNGYSRTGHGAMARVACTLLANGLDGGVLCSRVPRNRSDLGRARFGLTYARFGSTYVGWLETLARLLSGSNHRCSPIGRLNPLTLIVVKYATKLWNEKGWNVSWGSDPNSWTQSDMKLWSLDGQYFY